MTLIVHSSFLSKYQCQRVTGLDPASKSFQWLFLNHSEFNSKFHGTISDPCFNPGEDLTGLARGDAEFVLIIHSNSGGLGKRDPLGNYLCLLDDNAI